MHWFWSLSPFIWNSNFAALGKMSFAQSLTNWRSETLQGRSGKCHLQLKSPGKQVTTFKSSPHHHWAQDTRVKAPTHPKHYVFSWKLTPENKPGHSSQPSGTVSKRKYQVAQPALLSIACSKLGGFLCAMPPAAGMAPFCTRQTLTALFLVCSVPKILNILVWIEYCGSSLAEM